MTSLVNGDLGYGTQWNTLGPAKRLGKKEHLKAWGKCIISIIFKVLCIFLVDNGFDINIHIYHINH